MALTLRTRKALLFLKIFQLSLITFMDDFLVVLDEEDTVDDEMFRNKILGNRKVYTSTFKSQDADFDLGSKPQPDFNSNIKSLYKNLRENKDYNVFLLSSDSHQSDRLKKLIEDYEEDALIEELYSEGICDKIKFGTESLQEGFVVPDLKLIVYTEHQIFGRYFRQVKKRRKKFRGMTFDEVKELKPGDYVVHRDFGIRYLFRSSEDQSRKQRAGSREVVIF
ncbi:MAG: hypothetical protein AB2L26_11310 [Ignavibacteria bacterium]